MKPSPSLILFKATPAGARWITVHPHGKDAKGQPVMVQEDRHGTYRVIGGAGGSLNYLKLRGVKSKSAYIKEAAERSKAKRQQKKEQRAKEKKLGLAQARRDKEAGLRDRRLGGERDFIQIVAAHQGWDSKELALNEQDLAGLSDKARGKAHDQHHRTLLKRAYEAADLQRQVLREDAGRRLFEQTGEISLDSQDDEKLSVDDLAPVGSGQGLGYATDYKGRAEDRGLTASELAEEKASLQTEQSTEQQARTSQRRASAKELKRELEGLREPVLPGPTVAENEQDLTLIKAEKKLKHIQKQIRQAAKDDSPEPKAFVVEISDAELDREVKKDIENSLRTIKTRAFLSEVGKLAGSNSDIEKTLGRHIGVGAYSSINALALTSTGSALVDRDVVDVLGIAGSAEVLARRLYSDLTPDEVADIKHAMESFHKDHYLKTSQLAVDEAKEWINTAKQIELDAAINGDDLAALQELNNRKRDALYQAQRQLGTALGEMEANASLVLALNQGAQEQVQTSLGKVSVEDAIRRARAIGLERGDYTIHKQSSGTFLTVNAEGLDKLAQPVNREDLKHVKESLAIIEGQRDEDNWLPIGVANRPDLSIATPPGVAPQLAEGFTPGPDIDSSIKDYIGGRTADGDTPADIMADLLSHEMLEKVGEQSTDYFKALEKIAPLKDDAGKLIRAESHQSKFHGFADEFVQNKYGQTRTPLHRQQIPVTDKSVDAIHRALSQTPNGLAAFKPIGELDRSDQRALRLSFQQTLARTDPEVEDLKMDLSDHKATEPEKETDDMFGRGTNPAWVDWNNKREQLNTKINDKELTWPKYVSIMGGREQAYAAMQDQLRSKVVKGFHEVYNTLNPEAPLKRGRTVIRGNLNHADAIDPNIREQRLQEQRQMVDSLRERNQGRYASGSVQDKLDAARESREAALQAQMGIFATVEPDQKTETPLAIDERYTLGHSAERQLGALVAQVGKNFKPNQPTRLWQASMNGKYTPQQRAIKLLEHNERLMLAQGVGSGKSLISLAGFTHLHGQGKVKRGLFVVPSNVQGQLNGESLRYLEPGKYQWANDTEASRADRLKSYADPDNHFVAVTHHSFRDDMLHLGAEHAGIKPEAMAEKLGEMAAAERKAWMQDTMQKAGIDFQYLAVDEGHDLLNRAGKENSTMANVVDALSDNTRYYLNASADPVKNDPSEIYDMLNKMNPARYDDRAAFMRRYGVDTESSKEALRRELVRHFYPGKISSGVKAEKKTINVDLSSTQHEQLTAIDKASANARLARMKGNIDIESLKVLSPDSFAKLPKDRHQALAERLNPHIGLLKDTAVKRTIDTGPDNAKVAEAVDVAAKRRGKPGIIFARNQDTVQRLTEQLQREGHRVITITGKDTAKDKEGKRVLFNPEQGEAQADILIASDAGSTGMNAQRGQWVLQMDTPETAKTHAQRRGRIDRLGQQNDVELLDLVGNHPAERQARDRLKTKYALRDIMTTPLEGLDDSGLALYLKQARSKTNATPPPVSEAA